MDPYFVEAGGVAIPLVSDGDLMNGGVLVYDWR